MKKNLPLIFALACAAPAFAQHVHGEGRLELTLDRETLSIELVIPLEAAVGFERPPRNDKEKAALAQAAAALEGVPFTPSAAAQCTLQEKRIHVPFTGGDDRHEAHSHAGGQHHADLEARFVFRCTQPAALQTIETSLFSSFKRLYRLEARRVGPSGQGAQRLTPKRPHLAW
ncbi:MAG: DUF2796 domain-containing protein [Rhodocyclaceae bacterium]|nr:DUF2796 domain-containing protein [Rhodocyclaceae bacterium]